MTEDIMSDVDWEHEYEMERVEKKRQDEAKAVAIEAETAAMRAAHDGLVGALWIGDDKAVNMHAAILGIIPAQVDDLRRRVRMAKENQELSRSEPEARAAFEKAKAALDDVFKKHGDDHPQFFKARAVYEQAKAAYFEAERGTLCLANAHADFPHLVSRDRLTPHALAKIEQDRANIEQEQKQAAEHQRLEKIQALQRRIDAMQEPNKHKVALSEGYYRRMAERRVEVTRLKAELAELQGESK